MKPFSYQQKLISLPIHNLKCNIHPDSHRYSPKGVLWTTFAFLSHLRPLALSLLRPLALSLFLLLSFSLPAQQQWTEPINISNLGGYCMDPDMVIDHNGVIHIVWNYQYSAYHWLILYTKSEDDGLTWTEPLDLLQNTDLWMLQPHIACDSKNKLYVTYTHDGNSWTPEGRLIKMLTYDGHQWSEPIVVSEGMPGSHYNYIIVDHNDRIYVSWDYGPSGKNYFRYLENNTWSEMFCPYPNSAYYALTEACIDTSNNLHWIGSFGHSNILLQYFLYDYPSNTWYPPEQPVQDTIMVGLDIALNIDQLPETAYRKYETNPAYGSDATMHTKKEGNLWSYPNLVSGTDKRQKGQQIAIDQNNDVHVVEYEYYNSSNPEKMLIHYYESGSKWIRQAIDSSNHFCNFPKLIHSKNRLYLVYYKSEVSLIGDLRFSKYDIITKLNEETPPSPELIIYPNPSNGNIYIKFSNNKQQHIDLSVYDMTGKHILTLINKNLPLGKQRILWKGTDKNGKEVKSGSYIVRLKSGSPTRSFGGSGRKTVSQIVEIIK